MGNLGSAQLFLLLATFGLHSVVATRLSDVSALLALKTSWGNPASLASWVNDPCTNGWVGVTCTSVAGDMAVTALVLPGLGLAGPISDQIGNLTGLTLLHLGGNPITGQLPKELGNLVNLQYLYINSTRVTGQVPDGLGALGQLVELRLDFNQLSGSVPYDLTQLKSIQTMQFDNNNFNGSIPYQFGGLPALKGLFMQNNNLSGQIPNSFSQSPNLEILALFNNSLQGNVPQEFGSLKRLRGLYLQYNLITGPIPDALANCGALVELFLNNNQMSGPIPSSIVSLPFLTNLVLSNNQFTGTLPNPPGPALQAVLVDNNTLTGSIPSSYASIPNFRYTPNDFCSYQIGFVCQGGGCLRTPGPQCQAQAPAPAPIPVAPAPITVIPPPLNTSAPLPSNATPTARPTPTPTPIPIPIPMPTSVGTAVPTSGGLTCPPGQQISSLSGTPLCVSPMQANFRLADRNLPDWTPDFQTSFINDLAGQIGLSPNQINITRVAQGSILVNADFLPISGTSLDNQTVATIQSRLVGNNAQLALGNNRYGNVFVTDLISPATGGVSTLAPTPASDSGSSGLGTGAIIGIIAAGLVFLIAVALGAYLLVTRKKGQGDHKAPASSSRPADKSDLFELPVYDTTPKADHTQPDTAPAPSYSPYDPERLPDPAFSPKNPVAAPAAAVSARTPSNKSLSPRPLTPPAATPTPEVSPTPRNGAALFSPKTQTPPVVSPRGPTPEVSPTPRKSPSFFSRKKKEVKSPPPPLDVGPAALGAAALRSQLVVDIAARNFSLRELQTATNNFAGGNLVGEGGLGRVYRAGMEDKEFAVKRLDLNVAQSEEAFLREVAALAGLHHPHVVELVGYCSEGPTRILVHEFVPNRTLQDHLHGDRETGRKPGTPITWNARMKIALGMARGLEYLHQTHSPPVVHSCFKTANVLLDHDLVPKISDVAVAKLFPQGADKQMSTQMLGTFAYAAPEFSMTGEHTIKGDVYSFGVVLLELMTGRKPVDSSRPRYEQSLVRWATPMLHSLERLQEMVDPELEGIYPSKSLLKFAEIVSECVQPEAEFRPSMSEVVEQLQTHLVPFAGFNARSMRKTGSQSSMTPPQQSPMPAYSRSYYDHPEEED